MRLTHLTAKNVKAAENNEKSKEAREGVKGRKEGQKTEDLHARYGRNNARLAGTFRR